MLLALLGVFAAFLARLHLHPANPRVAYALVRLPAAMLSGLLFLLAAGVVRQRLARPGAAVRCLRSTPAVLAGLCLLFLIFWLPVLLTGGFVQDDWMLLLAAAVRRSIAVHPALAWSSLDSVDGNFRPLGTVLYLGWLWGVAGTHPLPYLLGSFIVGLAGTLLVYALARELGYGRGAGAVASAVYMSRGINYTSVAWVSALGDGLSILFCGLAAWAVLRATKRAPAQAIGLHLLGVGCFLLALGSKQSAFAAPPIIALLLLLRPGSHAPVSLGRRLAEAAAALAVYGGLTAWVFLHARHLLASRTPYPVSLSIHGVFNTFSFLTWYLVPMQFPDAHRSWNALTSLTGIALAAAAIAMVRRFPGIVGVWPRDVLFCTGAALLSIALFTLLPSRGAPYYGGMMGFWLSIALGIVLTRCTTVLPGARRSAMLVFVLVVSGFYEIRVKQTALIPSGGYIWGTFGMDRERAEFRALQQTLAGASGTLVLRQKGGVPVYTPSLAMLADPRLGRVLAFDPVQGAWTGNDLQGKRPADTPAERTDPDAFNWDRKVRPDGPKRPEGDAPALTFDLGR